MGRLSRREAENKTAPMKMRGHLTDTKKYRLHFKITIENVETMSSPQFV